MEQSQLIETFQISSKILKQDRTINVWIPNDFKDDVLPVLYLLDGGLQEKFNQIQQLLIHLIKENKIKPVLLVGIENIERNYDFTGNTTVRKDRKWVPKYGNAARFKRFITEELIPTIDTKYKTNHKNAIVGESLGGLLVMDLLYHHPEHFKSFISIDPSLWWNNHLLIDEIMNGMDLNHLKDKKLWIAASQVISISELTDQFVSKLKSNPNLNNNWLYIEDKNQTHFTIFNHTIQEALHWILKK